MKRRQTGNRSESGQVLILTVLAMAVLLGMAAMAIDVGLFLHDRRNLQNAADAAALAGAADLPDNPVLAVIKAREWAEDNGIDLSSELELVEVRTTYVPNDTMHVAVKRDFSFVFGRVLGLDQANVGADASAVVGSPGGLAGLRPWAVQEKALLGLEPGDQATLKYSAADVTTGNFQPIRIDGPGGKVYDNSIRYGSGKELCSQGQERPDCPSVTSTETGNLVGPTRAAVEWAETNTSSECNAFAEVFLPNPSDPDEYYLNPDCNPFVTPQVTNLIAIVPVIGELCNGTCDVTITRFAMFFIEGVDCTAQGQGNSCTVQGTYVRAAADVGGTVGPYDPEGALSFVRLIE